MHEAQLHESNAFITLTYADEHLPQDRSLDKREFQLFIKRLRKSIQPQRLRYFHCGEYGAKLGRPHYHACLFGFDFPDKELQRYSKTGEKLYRSDLLDSAWQNKGWALIGEVTFQSAAYVARYITKKITGEAAHDHYLNVDKHTGEILNPLQPEYTTMSRRPGIGSDWFNKYAEDVYPSDEVICKGMAVKPPKYYDQLYEIQDPDSFREIKETRRKSAKARKHDNTPERLEAKRKVKLAQLNQLKRNYENDL